MTIFRAILSITIFLLFLQNTDAQDVTPTFSANDIDWIDFPAAEYIENQDKNEPFVFATKYALELDAYTEGIFRQLDDGSSVWAIGLCTEWAENVNVMLTNATLLPDECVNIYDPTGDNVQTFTALENQPNGIIQSFPIDGDSLIIEFQSVSGVRPEFVIQDFNCGFLSLHDRRTTTGLKAGSYGDSDECEVDASCNTTVLDIKQSVCRLIFNGSTLGSGALINNTNCDGRPLVTTAAHCLYLDSSDEYALNSLYAMFNFEVPYCQEGILTLDYEILSGGTLLTYCETTDLAVIELASAPSAMSRPYWSGWSLATSHSGIGYTVHHPYGDVRKVSVASSISEGSYGGTTNSGTSFSSDAHWYIAKWTSGVTEGGSSGAGLWNSDLKLIGNLTGGAATCDDPVRDYFWKYIYNWDLSVSGYSTLSELLDPAGTDATTLDGAYLSSVVYVEDFNFSSLSTAVSSRPSSGKGYLAGHNSQKTLAIAESYGSDNAETEIVAVYLGTYKMRDSDGSKFTLTIWSDNNGLPGEELYTETHKNSVLSTSKLNYLELSEAVTVSGKFHVGVQLPDIYTDSATDTLAFYHSASVDNVDHAHFLVDNEWVTASDLLSTAGNQSVFFGYKGRSLSDSSNSTIALAESDVRVKKISRKVEISGNELTTINLYDTSGRLIAAYDAQNSSTYSFNLPSQHSGIFLIRINTTSSAKTVKIVNNK